MKKTNGTLQKEHSSNKQGGQIIIMKSPLTGKAGLKVLRC